LGQLANPQALEALAALLKDQDSSVRKHAYNALGRLGDQRAVPELVKALPDWDARHVLGDALTKLSWKPTSDPEQVYFWICDSDVSNLRKEWPKTKKVLLGDLQSTDQRKIKNAVCTFIALGNKEVVPDLAEVLTSHGSEELAAIFMNCGDSSLAQSALAWTSLRGIKESDNFTAPNPSWGSW
jgi:hypothetical protein